MSRYGIAGQQYFDNNGAPLSGGLLHFYETNTSNPKDTFSDEAESVANTNPVELTAAGRQPDVFFTGQARVVLAKADGTVLVTTDPVGTSATLGGLDDWNQTRTYAADDLAKGSNGLYYRSIVGSNVGNNPISSPTFWMEIRFVNNYNTSYFYRAGDVAFKNNRLWVSLISANVGNDPETNPTLWKALDVDLWPDLTVHTATFAAAVGRHYLCNTTSAAFTPTLPASPAHGDRVRFTDYAGTWPANNLTLGRNGQLIMGLAEDLVLDIAYASVTIQFDSTRGWILV